MLANLLLMTKTVVLNKFNVYRFVHSVINDSEDKHSDMARGWPSHNFVALAPYHHFSGLAKPLHSVPFLQQRLMRNVLGPKLSPEPGVRLWGPSLLASGLCWNLNVSMFASWVEGSAAKTTTRRTVDEVRTMISVSNKEDQCHVIILKVNTFLVIDP